MKLLAQDSIDEIFGTPIKAPGPEGINSGNVADSFGRLLSFSISMIFFVAGLFLIVYLMWGSLNWIASAGDSERVTKARNHIMQALIGILILIATFVIWVYIASQIVGVIEFDPGEGLRFELPRISAP